MKGAVALSYNAWLEMEELPGLSSLSSLHYVFEHINTCLLLVQPMKNHPDITENILTGTLKIKSSKQTRIFIQNFQECAKRIFVYKLKFLTSFYYRTKVVGLMRKVYVYYRPTCAWNWPRIDETVFIVPFHWAQYLLWVSVLLRSVRQFYR